MILSIDTSGPTTSVALFSVSADLLSVVSESSESHSTKLEQFVRQVLIQSGAEAKDLKLILLGAGPGSFTGLRIAFAFTKGLALALGIGICQISSLQAVARHFDSIAEHILVLDDARRDQYFAATYKTKPVFTASSHEQIVDKAWIQSWREAHKDSLIVSAYSLNLATEFASIELLPKELAVCLGESYFKSATKPQISNSYLEIANLSPNYIRQVSALSIADRQRMGMLTVSKGL